MTRTDVTVATKLAQVWVAAGSLGYRALIPCLGISTDHYATKPAALQAAGVAVACMPHRGAVSATDMLHPGECLSGGYLLRLD